MNLTLNIHKASAKDKKVALVLKEFKDGKLKSGGSGKKVTNPKQAVAIAYSEAEKFDKAEDKISDDQQKQFNKETEEYQDYTKNTVAFDVPYKKVSSSNVKKVIEELKNKWYRIEKHRTIETDEGKLVLFERGNKVIAVWRVDKGDVFIVNVEL